MFPTSAGAAGSFAIQFAKLAGARVITTVGSAAKAKLAADLGADVVLNHNEVDVADALAQSCPDGIDVVMDGVGGSIFDAALRNLAPNGRILVTGYISEYPHTRNDGSLPFDPSVVHRLSIIVVRNGFRYSQSVCCIEVYLYLPLHVCALHVVHISLAECICSCIFEKKHLIG